MTQVSAVLAFGAGLLSFLSPCVFPLIPSYLFFVGGMGLQTAGGNSEETQNGKTMVLARTLFFILGFSVIFVTSGLILSSFIIISAVQYIDIAAGIIIIILGLNILFDFLKFLNYEKRFQIKNRPKGFIGAFITGSAFGAGWTPCVGPILTSILLMAGQSGKLPLALFYLLLYSAGLGLPFLAAAFFFDHFMKGAEKIKKHLPLIQKISGIFLVITGILILSGRFQALNRVLQRWQFFNI